MLSQNNISNYIYMQLIILLLTDFSFHSETLKNTSKLPAVNLLMIFLYDAGVIFIQYNLGTVLFMIFFVCISLINGKP